MDLVYLVGEDKHHDHLELRYSIRSMVKHLDKISNLIVVGECPMFLKNVIHIPVPDAHKHNGARNIYEKILAACNDPRVSKNFLSNSDDYFLNKDFAADSFPCFFDGDLEQLNSKLGYDGGYKVYVENTLSVLKERKLSVLNFNVHAPMIINKERFSMIMPAFNWTIHKGYISKSLYANAAGITGTPATDIKIYTPKTRTALQRKLKDAPFYSTNEHAINEFMKDMLQELYPEKSKWEI